MQDERHILIVLINGERPAFAESLANAIQAAKLNLLRFLPGEPLRVVGTSGQTVITTITEEAATTAEEAYALGASAFFGSPVVLETVIQTITRLATPEVTRWTIERARELNPPYARKGALDLELDQLPQHQKENVFTVGQGGFFVALREDFPNIGDGLGFRIQFIGTGDTPIQGEGVVRWVRPKQTELGPPGMGVEILCLAPESYAPFEELVAQHRPRAFIPKG